MILDFNSPKGNTEAKEQLCIRRQRSLYPIHCCTYLKQDPQPGTFFAPNSRKSHYQ